ncbi:4Fe-4S binding protein [Thermoproteota archaeon]
MGIKIDYKKCCWKDGRCSSCSCKGACEGCVEVCATGALKRKRLIEYDSSLCSDCGACIAACKHDAISIED